LKDLKEEFEGLHITEITYQMLQAFLDRMKAQGFARQTINLRKVTASLVFDYAVLTGYLDNSPALLLKVPRNAPHKARELPKADEIDKVLNAEGQFADLARFLYYTGCRLGEALALTSDDIKDGYITINKSLYWEGNKPKIKSTPKTSAGVREIPVLKPIEAFLQKRRGIIFKGKNGGYMLRSEMQQGWRKLRKDNGINITAHQLRHGFATLCYDADLNEKDAAELLGHSSVELTKDIYTHITAERNRINAEKLNSFVTK
jgi:integrase